ncbi:efflux RND transporter periplasmic adaptor subunit [Thalassotalea agarivorans]|uniref:Membrane fusion protein, multidrug efflux system n=1 Tax=Thalassotalea agarivorans TaxID=349064 RepID=A0A1I0HFU0_THASX|nr:efflux RND transporter periplasmic adaptor subunit [Thalassotalea agarivorans]SET82820.1 membrane fusion protein, multidrug efflux system [Thalassotalea agarivorans]
MQKLLFRKMSKAIVTVLPLGLLVSVTGCGDNQQAAVQAPPPAVSVYTIKTEEIGRYREFVARTEASKVAELKARVEGELLERRFKEGSLVTQGQVLFKIDPAKYQADLTKARADLHSRQSAAATAKRNLARGQKISKDGFISQSDLDKLDSEASQAESAVKAAEAALEQAELNLSYTTVSAPFDARIGKVTYNVGNIVGPTSGSLAELTVTDPSFVNFQIEEEGYIDYLQRHREFKNPKDIPIDMSIRLPNNQLYKEKGYIDYADTRINEGTGTVELRAVFSNPERIIIPGMFVTLIIETRDKTLTALVPQVAVQTNQQGKFVLVVDESNKVVQRHVELGRRMNAMWAVESGLKQGERVIIEGVQKVRAGIEVMPAERKVDPVTGTIESHEQSGEESGSTDTSSATE